RVPKLDERILYKDSGEADFTPLMLERIWTYCSPAQLDLLKALSVYNRPVPVEALKAFELSISVADRKHLEELSLIDYSHQSGLYMIHPSTARYTRGHFSEKERKHVNISAAQYLTVSPTDPAFDVETAIEARNLYLEANEWEKAADLSLELESYLTATLRPQLAFDLLLEIEDKNCNKESRLRILRRLDFYYTIFGQMDKAITVNETLIKLHEESGDQKGIALCHRQLANAYDNKRKFDTALEHYDLAVSIFRELGENQAASFCLLQVGKILRKRGKYDEAVESYKKSEQLARTVGDDKGVTECLSHLGRACEERGQWDDALDYYNRCRQLLEKLDDQKEIASILHRLGNVYFLMGNFDEAFNYYTSSFETSERINDFHGMGYSLGQLGMIHQRRGREADALSHYTRSMEIFRKIEDRKGMASTLHQLGRISQSSGQLDEALAKYTESLSIREEDTDMPGMALTHGQLGMLHYDRQEYEEALRSSLKAFLLFSKLNAPGVQLARKNILKVQPHLPEEKFKEIMKEFNIDFQAPATQ
ncbi:MAG: tetratricopeptide repeat protein, partial [bacterium]|nr:tetratricopeptide repeat protein [bacterium]